MHKFTLQTRKRSNVTWVTYLTVYGIAIILALAVCGVVTTVLTGEDPLSVYATILSGAAGTKRRIWATLQGTAVLLCVSLALTPAFRMRFWNVGGEGQILVGALSAASCMILLGDRIPGALLYALMAVTSVAAGAVWGIVPAVCKANWNTNETLSTLMLNYIAKQIVAFFVVLWENPKGSGNIGVINSSTNAGWFPSIGGQKYLLNVLIVLCVLVFIYFYLEKTKHGYELSVVGESERTARYIGISVKKVIVRTMALSGALCGLAGLILVAGASHTVTATISANRGFTAVMVSWMAKFQPLLMVLTSLLIVFLEQGAGEITTVYGLNSSFADILTGIIIFFLIGCDFFVNYRLCLHRNGKEEEK